MSGFFATWVRRMTPALVGLVLASSHAQDIRVVKPGAARIAVDWSEFEAAGEEGRLFLATLQASLHRSGWFETAVPGRGEWRVRGQFTAGRGGLQAQCRVNRVSDGTSVLSRNWRGDTNQVRRLAFTVADAFVEAIGHKGFASARLVLVGNRTGNKELYLADSDGEGLQQMTRDGSLSLYPRWSPDNRKITYIGYLMGFPDLYQVDLASGQRTRISKFPGLNAGGAISPDGRHMALILSREGNPDLFVRDLKSGELTRLTHTLRAVESSPTWSPDGRRIAYVSDQSGTPQIFILSREGGAPRRVTVRGTENVAPHWGANGWIAFASRSGRRHQLGILHPETGEERWFPDPAGANLEDPSWAPSGRHLVCTRIEGGRSTISLIDIQSGESIPLIRSSGNWFSASWSW